MAGPAPQVSLPPVQPPVFDPVQPIPTPQASFTPAQVAPQRSFSGLPGLFMSDPASTMAPPALNPLARPTSQPSGIPMPYQSAPNVCAPVTVSSGPSTPVALAQQVPATKKRPEPSDFNSTPALTKRPFGQSRTASEDEAFIIENSDDEDGDSRMDLDDPLAPNESESKPAKNVLRLPDFPPKAGLQQSSLPGTPGAGTPGSATYEQKLKEIEEYKLKIAAREAKAKAAARMAAHQSGLTGQPGLPGIAAPSRTASFSTTDTPSASVHHPANGSMASATIIASETPDQQSTTNAARSASAASLARSKERERLQQRLQELERAKKAGYSSSSVPAPAPTPATVEDNVPTLPTVKSAAEQAPPQVQVLAAAPATADDDASEDGEVDDESDFDFYETNASSNPKPSARVDNSHVDSQATTASAATSDRALANEQNVGPVEESQWPEMLDEDVGIDQHTEPPSLSQEDGAISQHAPINGQPTSPEAQNEPPTPDSDDMEMQIESSSEESSDEDEDDLNQPASTAPKNVAEIAQPPVGAAEDDSSDEDESSDESSDSSEDSEDYEPKPNAELQPDTISAQPLATSASRLADDDLAPELQPSIEVAGPITQVRSTFDRLHGD